VPRFEGATRVVEVGVGRRPAVALALADRGVEVLTTDLVERAVPEPLGFARDDITAPTRSLYAGADWLYALHCPPELQRPLATLAASVEAACAFSTLGGDPALVPAIPERLGETTLFVVDDGAVEAARSGSGESP